MQVVIDGRTTQDEIKYNGVGRYSRFIIEYLITQFPQTQYTLIMYSSPSTLDQFLQDHYKNVRVIRIGKYKDKGIISKTIHNLDLFFHIRLNIALHKIKEKDSIFFSLYFFRGLPVFRIPTVVAIHDFALPEFNLYSTISPIHNLIRKFQYWYELYRLPLCKAVLCSSSYTKKDLFKYFPKIDKKKVHAIHLGIQEDRGEEIDFEKYLPKDWEKRKYLLYLGGGLTKNKNSNGVVDGYSEFVSMLKNDGVKENEIPYLVIAGKNFSENFSRESKRFRRYVRKSNLEELVWYTGFYEDEQRWNLIDNCFGYIHLSLFEGFGFGVAEAMRAKVPVIAHKGTSYIELINKGGVLVDGKERVEVGKAIYKIYKDREFAKEISMIGHKESQKFTWEITALKTHDILKSLVK